MRLASASSHIVSVHRVARSPVDGENVLNPEELSDLARRWASADPDPETRQQTQLMLQTADEERLRACFGDRLGFGTAGIRGPMGPGPNRMNLGLVRQVTWGLAQYVRAHSAPGSVIVVGRDGRRNSAAFADAAARLCTLEPARMYKQCRWACGWCASDLRPLSSWRV